jgi:hypothetical protein
MARELPTAIDTTLEVTGTAPTRVLGVSAAFQSELAGDIASAVAAEAATRGDADTALASALLDESTARGDADAALAAAIADAQADATAALFELGTASATVRHLYVDPVAGSDANDGLSTSTPVQTAARLFALIPLVIDQPTLVHMASGTLDLAGTPIPYGLGSRLLCFYADESWDPRGDLYTVVDTGAAGVGTNASDIVAAIAQTLNARRGMSIRFTSGNAATAQRRTVHSNSTASYTPCAAFSPAPVAGDTYEVFTSNAVIRVTAGQFLTTSSPASAVSEGLAFVGVDFDTSTSGSLALGASMHQFYGCRVRSSLFGPAFSAGTYGSVNAGLNTGTLALNTQFGLSQSLWGGWALAQDNASSGLTVPTFGQANGMFVCKGGVTNAGRFTPTGGWYAFLNQAIIPGCSSNISGPSAALATTFGDATDTTTRITCNEGEIRFGSNTRIQMTHATNPAISCERNGLVLFTNAAVAGENANAAGPDIRVRYGGRCLITHAGAPGFGKAAGTASWIVEGAASQLKSYFSAAGVALRDAAAPESFARRVA